MLLRVLVIPGDGVLEGQSDPGEASDPPKRSRPAGQGGSLGDKTQGVARKSVAAVPEARRSARCGRTWPSVKTARCYAPLCSLAGLSMSASPSSRTGLRPTGRWPGSGLTLKLLHVGLLHRSCGGFRQLTGRWDRVRTTNSVRRHKIRLRRWYRAHQPPFSGPSLVLSGCLRDLPS